MHRPEVAGRAQRFPRSCANGQTGWTRTGLMFVTCACEGVFHGCFYLDSRWNCSNSWVLQLIIKYNQFTAKTYPILSLTKPIIIYYDWFFGWPECRASVYRWHKCLGHSECGVSAFPARGNFFSPVGLIHIVAFILTFLLVFCMLLMIVFSC